MRTAQKGTADPTNLDIAIWTDGSLNREQLLPDIYPICGAAAIVLVTDLKNTINERLEDSNTEEVNKHTIKTKLSIPNAVSSYETEIIAIQAGLEETLCD